MSEVNRSNLRQNYTVAIDFVFYKIAQLEPKPVAHLLRKVICDLAVRRLRMTFLLTFLR